jgi:hypothetical protein
MQNLNDTRFLLTKWKKPLRGSQTQDIHYSEDKTSYKVSYLKGSSMESFTLGPTPKIDFN